jgi:hypothetical protein
MLMANVKKSDAHFQKPAVPSATTRMKLRWFSFS